MAPSVEHKGNERHGWSGPPVRNHHSSPRRRNSPRRGRSPAPRKSSPGRVGSPPRSSHSQKNRSLVHEKLPDRARSPRNARPHSPVRSGSSRSLSPRSKRLRRAQADREEEKLEDKEHRRSSGKEDRDRGRPRDREEVRDASHDRKSVNDKIDSSSSRFSKDDRSISPERRSHRRRHSSSSPSRVSKPAARNEVGAKPQESENVRGDDIDNDSVAKMKAAEAALNEKEKQKPSFELSGKLAEETNKVRGVTLLFTEPGDARKPNIRWRLYVFKSGEVLNEPLYVHRQSCYLFGRERRVADIPTDHPSCSKQHAVIQYRLVEKEQPDGLMSKQVRPYIMDLGSTNGTFINDNRIEPQRYYELFEKDTIKFGNSRYEINVLVELLEHSSQ